MPQANDNISLKTPMAADPQQQLHCVWPRTTRYAANDPIEVLHFYEEPNTGTLSKRTQRLETPQANCAKQQARQLSSRVIHKKERSCMNPFQTLIRHICKPVQELETAPSILTEPLPRLAPPQIRHDNEQCSGLLRPLPMAKIPDGKGGTTVSTSTALGRFQELSRRAQRIDLGHYRGGEADSYFQQRDTMTVTIPKRTMPCYGPPPVGTQELSHPPVLLKGDAAIIYPYQYVRKATPDAGCNISAITNPIVAKIRRPIEREFSPVSCFSVESESMKDQNSLHSTMSDVLDSMTVSPLSSPSTFSVGSSLHDDSKYCDQSVDANHVHALETYLGDQRFSLSEFSNSDMQSRSAQDPVCRSLSTVSYAEQHDIIYTPQASMVSNSFDRQWQYIPEVKPVERRFSFSSDFSYDPPVAQSESTAYWAGKCNGAPHPSMQRVDSGYQTCQPIAKSTYKAYQPSTEQEDVPARLQPDVEVSDAYFDTIIFPNFTDVVDQEADEASEDGYFAARFASPYGNRDAGSIDQTLFANFDGSWSDTIHNPLTNDCSVPCELVDYTRPVKGNPEPLSVYDIVPASVPGVYEYASEFAQSGVHTLMLQWESFVPQESKVEEENWDEGKDLVLQDVQSLLSAFSR